MPSSQTHALPLHFWLFGACSAYLMKHFFSLFVNSVVFEGVACSQGGCEFSVYFACFSKARCFFWITCCSPCCLSQGPGLARYVSESENLHNVATCFAVQPRSLSVEVDLVRWRSWRSMRDGSARALQICARVAPFLEFCGESDGRCLFDSILCETTFRHPRSLVRLCRRLRATLPVERKAQPSQSNPSVGRAVFVGYESVSDVLVWLLLSSSFFFFNVLGCGAHHPPPPCLQVGQTPEEILDYEKDAGPHIGSIEAETRCLRWKQVVGGVDSFCVF